MYKISLGNLYGLLLVLFSSEDRNAIPKIPSIFILGRAGVGKSQIVREAVDTINEIARSKDKYKSIPSWLPEFQRKLILDNMANSNAELYDMEFIDLRAAQLEPTDIRGLLYPNADRTACSWICPDWLPLERPIVSKTGEITYISDPFGRSKKKGVLFLDEFNQADPLVRRAFFQLILDRRIGEFKLSDYWFILSAGNTKEENKLADTFAVPERSRFVWFEIDTSISQLAKDWVNWAKNNNINPLIISFIDTQNKALLAKQDIVHSEGYGAYNAPRTWHFLNNLLEFFKIDTPKNEEILNFLKLLACASVGKESGNEFYFFVKKIVGVDPEGLLNNGGFFLDKGDNKYKNAFKEHNLMTNYFDKSIVFRIMLDNWLNRNKQQLVEQQVSLILICLKNYREGLKEENKQSPNKDVKEKHLDEIYTTSLIELKNKLEEEGLWASFVAICRKLFRENKNIGVLEFSFNAREVIDYVFEPLKQLLEIVKINLEFGEHPLKSCSFIYNPSIGFKDLKDPNFNVVEFIKNNIQAPKFLEVKVDENTNRILSYYADISLDDLGLKNKFRSVKLNELPFPSLVMTDAKDVVCYLNYIEYLKDTQKITCEYMIFPLNKTYLIKEKGKNEYIKNTLMVFNMVYHCFKDIFGDICNIEKKFTEEACLSFIDSLTFSFDNNYLDKITIQACSYNLSSHLLAEVSLFKGAVRLDYSSFEKLLKTILEKLYDSTVINTIIEAETGKF